MVNTMKICNFIMVIITVFVLNACWTASEMSIKTETKANKKKTESNLSRQKKYTKVFSKGLSIEQTKNIVKILDAHLFAMETILQEIRVLAVRSAHGTYSNQDRRLFDIQLRELLTEAVRLRNECQYNQIKLLNSSHEKFPDKVYVSDKHNGLKLVYKLPNIFPQTFGLNSWKENVKKSNIRLLAPSGANRAIGLSDNALSVILQERVRVRSFGKRLRIVQQLHKRLISVK